MKMRKIGLEIVKIPKKAEEPSSAVVVSGEPAQRVEVDASLGTFKLAFKGGQARNPFSLDAVMALPEELAHDLEMTFSALKPPKQDLYQALCAADPELAKEIGPADLELMDKMLKNV